MVVSTLRRFISERWLTAVWLPLLVILVSAPLGYLYADINALEAKVATSNLQQQELLIRLSNSLGVVEGSLAGIQERLDDVIVELQTLRLQGVSHGK